MHIRPKLFYDEGQRVVAELRSPYFGGIAQSAIRGSEYIGRRAGRAVANPGEGLGVVCVCRDGRRQHASNDLGEVELRAARVGSGHETSTDGIAGAMHEPAVPQLVIPRVLTKQGGKNCAYHKIFDGPVRKRSPEAFGITLRALAKTGFAVFRLADTRQKAVPGNLDIVERTPEYDLEFLPRGERRQFASTFQRQEIRQRIKKPVVRGS